MDWIELDQDRNRWREIVSAVMNLRVQSSEILCVICCAKNNFSLCSLFVPSCRPHRTHKNMYDKGSKMIGQYCGTVIVCDSNIDYLVSLSI